MNYLDAILKLTDLFIFGSITYERFVASQARIKEMIAEGRDPSDKEFAEMFAGIDTAIGRIDAADERLNGED